MWSPGSGTARMGPGSMMCPMRIPGMLTLCTSKLRLGARLRKNLKFIGDRKFSDFGFLSMAVKVIHPSPVGLTTDRHLDVGYHGLDVVLPVAQEPLYPRHVRHPVVGLPGEFIEQVRSGDEVQHP